VSLCVSVSLCMCMSLSVCVSLSELTKEVLDASDTVSMLLAKLADSSQQQKDVSHAT